MRSLADLILRAVRGLGGIRLRIADIASGVTGGLTVACRLSGTGIRVCIEPIAGG